MWPIIYFSPASHYFVNVYLLYLDYNASEASEISFQAGDVIEVIEASEVASADAWWEGRNKRTGAIGSFPLAFTQGWEGVAVASLSVATAGVSLSRATSVKSVGSMLNSSLNRSGGGGGGGGALFGGTAATAASVVIQEERVKAVYEYKATCEGELDLQVGDMVTILNKDTGSEAWWEGESERGRVKKNI